MPQTFPVHPHVRGTIKILKFETAQPRNTSVIQCCFKKAWATADRQIAWFSFPKKQSRSMIKICCAISACNSFELSKVPHDLSSLRRFKLNPGSTVRAVVKRLSLLCPAAGRRIVPVWQTTFDVLNTRRQMIRFMNKPDFVLGYSRIYIQRFML